MDSGEGTSCVYVGWEGEYANNTNAVIHRLVEFTPSYKIITSKMSQENT
jgi:hypothetical protein